MRASTSALSSNSVALARTSSAFRDGRQATQLFACMRACVCSKSLAYRYGYCTVERVMTRSTDWLRCSAVAKPSLTFGAASSHRMRSQSRHNASSRTITGCSPAPRLQLDRTSTYRCGRRLQGFRVREVVVDLCSNNKCACLALGRVVHGVADRARAGG